MRRVYGCLGLGLLGCFVLTVLAATWLRNAAQVPEITYAGAIRL